MEQLIHFHCDIKLHWTFPFCEKKFLKYEHIDVDIQKCNHHIMEKKMLLQVKEGHA